MYLEISPRGSGKTHRLIQHAFKTLNENSEIKVNIICPNLRNSTFIKEKLIRMGADANRIRTNGITDAKTRVYCDDFDFNKKYKTGNYFIDNNGYYVTGIARKRKFGKCVDGDFLLSLIKANNNKYESYFGFFSENYNEMVENNLRKTLNREEFDKEILNVLWE